MKTKISSLIELMQALGAGTPQELEIQSSIVCPYSITLPKGTKLSGADKETCILSFNNGDGVALTADNSISNLTVLASPAFRAIYFQTGLEDMGKISLDNLSVSGQVSLIVRLGTKALRIEADQIDITAADARRYSEQPQKYGVNVMQGAFTLYNFNGDPDSRISATLTNITAGRKNAPVFGSGIFISGFSDNGGFIDLEKLTTGAVYTHGLLPYGTADMITGGVFINYGVNAKEVTNDGEIVTYGANDMVLDNWGKVGNWTANAPITSYGPSGIGFVNFGSAENFTANAPIKTYGLGSRGFNQYDGTVGYIKLKSIETHGDGSIGIQISKPIGKIEIEDNIITHGSLGDSLLKGVLTKLPAIAFSIKPGGSVESLIVRGHIETFGDHVDTFLIEGGTLKQINVDGHISAGGSQSNAIVLRNGGTSVLTNVQASSKSGQVLINEGGHITDQTGFNG